MSKTPISNRTSETTSMDDVDGCLTRPIWNLKTIRDQTSSRRSRPIWDRTLKSVVEANRKSHIIFLESREISTKLPGGLSHTSEAHAHWRVSVAGANREPFTNYLQSCEISLQEMKWIQSAKCEASWRRGMSHLISLTVTRNFPYTTWKLRDTQQARVESSRGLNGWRRGSRHHFCCVSHSSFHII